MHKKLYLNKMKNVYFLEFILLDWLFGSSR